jgi:protein involved in polysaccharide export with SLBB domain
MAKAAEHAAQNAGTDAEARSRKQAEATALRDRLRDGDFNVGDRIYLELRGGQEPFADTVVVRPGRVISLPNMPDISLQGVLRSELQGYLEREVARYIRSPEVRAQTYIRVSLGGPGVDKQGFYNFPSEMLFTDAIMQAGGLSPSSDVNDIQVKRGKEVVLAKNDSRRAIRDGWTLDQMSLRGGDQIVIGSRQGFDWWRTFRIVTLVLSSVLLVYSIKDRVSKN